VSVWRATGRLIGGVGSFCEELGFEVVNVRGLGSFVAALLKEKAVFVVFV